MRRDPPRIPARVLTPAFQREHPCPANGQRRGPCPGYVVDYIIPPECGGPDEPFNMQWQSIAAAKAKAKAKDKDKTERRCP